MIRNRLPDHVRLANSMRRVLIRIALAAAVASGLIIGAGSTAGAEPKPVYQVTAFDFGFVVPTFEAGKPRLNFTNTGSGPHMIGIAELPPGATTRQALDGEVPILREVGDAFALPGETNRGKFAELTPGNYGYACFIETPDGTPHYDLGMLGEFQIAG